MCFLAWQEIFCESAKFVSLMAVRLMLHRIPGVVIVHLPSATVERAKRCSYSEILCIATIRREGAE